MSTLQMHDRVLGWLLGLGDLQPVEVCHGYAVCCQCSECLERERSPEPAPVVRQPWEVEAA